MPIHGLTAHPEHVQTIEKTAPHDEISACERPWTCMYSKQLSWESLQVSRCGLGIDQCTSGEDLLHRAWHSLSERHATDGADRNVNTLRVWTRPCCHVEPLLGAVSRPPASAVVTAVRGAKSGESDRSLDRDPATARARDASRRSPLSEHHSKMTLNKVYKRLRCLLLGLIPSRSPFAVCAGRRSICSGDSLPRCMWVAGSVGTQRRGAIGSRWALLQRGPQHPSLLSLRRIAAGFSARFTCAGASGASLPYLPKPLELCMVSRQSTPGVGQRADCAAVGFGTLEKL
eukprot:scaffold3505_cov385-Prasinococcus_capsulatus_cf.AAC.11